MNSLVENVVPEGITNNLGFTRSSPRYKLVAGAKDNRSNNPFGMGRSTRVDGTDRRYRIRGAERFGQHELAHEHRIGDRSSFHRRQHARREHVRGRFSCICFAGSCLRNFTSAGGWGRASSLRAHHGLLAFGRGRASYSKMGSPTGWAHGRGPYCRWEVDLLLSRMRWAFKDLPFFVASCGHAHACERMVYQPSHDGGAQGVPLGLRGRRR